MGVEGTLWCGALFHFLYFFQLLIIFGEIMQLGMKFDSERSKTSILHVFPFNSEKKRGGVAVYQVITFCNP